MDTEPIRVFLSTTAVDILIKVIAAILFWVVGRWIIRRVVSVLRAGMNRSAVDADAHASISVRSSA